MSQETLEIKEEENIIQEDAIETQKGILMKEKSNNKEEEEEHQLLTDK